MEQEGATVAREPLLVCVRPQSIEPLPFLGPAAWAVFTSARAIEAAYELGAIPAGVKIAAVGPASADKLRAIGLGPDLVPEDMRAEGLAEAMKERTPQGAKVVFFRGDKALTTLPDRLRKAGFGVEEREVYHTLPIAQEEARRIAARIAAKTDVAILGSPSGVEVLGAATPLVEIARRSPRLLFAALGPSTAAALRAAGIERPVVAPSPKPEDVVDAIFARVGEIR